MRTYSLGVIILLLTSACSMPVEQETVSGVSTPLVAGEDGPASVRDARTAVQEIAREAPDPPAFNELLLKISELSHAPIFNDSRAELLIDGPATYRSMSTVIERAQQSIYLETYIFADDEVGQQFADQLMDKARKGITVCVIYDSIGSMGSSSDFFEQMEAAGVHVIEYNSLNPLADGNPLLANNRDHRKLLIVDDSVVFTGGINFSETYSSSSTRKPASRKLTEGWRDTHIAIHGPAVAGFRHTFHDQWLQQGGAPELVLESRSKPDKAGEDLIVALQSEGGASAESPIYRAYLDAIEMAVERIWITQAYFVPDDKLLEHLKLAARRGVDVRILVPGISDSNLVLYASRSHYAGLLQAGVRLYENSSSLLHAKTAVIDGVWSTVGSSNLDFRSFLHNDEVNAIVLGKDFGAQMETQFNIDIGVAQPLTLEQWQERPLMEKMQEIVSRTLDYWL